jgi:hypothetical protein
MAIHNIADASDRRFSRVVAEQAAAVRTFARNGGLRRWVQVRGIGESTGTVPELELWAAGDDETACYAVCGPDAQVRWRGITNPDRTEHPRWRSDSIDTVAGAKAIWLAGRVRAALGVPTVRVRLHLTDPDLDRYVLTVVAAKAGVTIEAVDAVEDNPAHQACREPGVVDWHAVDLPDLLDAAPAGERLAAGH